MKLSNKIFFYLIFIVFLPINIYSQNIHELNLMPFPKEVIVKEKKFRIDRDLSIGIKGIPAERLYSEATRFLRRLDDRTGLFFKQGYVTHDSNQVESKILIKVEKPGEIKLGENESYKLIITENNIQIYAPTDLGAMHCMQTLLQLVSIDTIGYYFPAIEINDFPRFPWRGLLIDVARHFMPIDVIKKNLDGMVALKLNVLHLHLSDDQGFRVECKTFPKLHELGSDNCYYTQTQIKEIIKYANDRGIRVYPEFDMPGHATSWFVGYPEYASAPGPYQIERKWGVFNPTFNPTLDKTYEFLDKFFKEMTALFSDEYIHIGGDENNGVQWNTNKDIQKFKEEKGYKDNNQLQAYFINRIQKIITKYGKKMIGWDEILHKDTPKSIVIQSWRDPDSLIKSAKQGYRGILSSGYYIDNMQSTSYHYLNDPIPNNSNITPEEESKILGGEATMWSEWVTKENIDSRIWPRSAAIAERFWSAREINDVEDMYKRLEYISFLLEEYGLKHISFQPGMLRRLTNDLPIKPLKILVDVIKPLEGYGRNDFEKYGGYEYMQYYPHSLVVDAALADPKPARDFNNLIDKFLKTQTVEEADQIKEYLTVLQRNHNQLMPIINNSPVLKEIEPLSKNLSALAQIGLEALALIEGKNKTDIEWMARANKIMSECSKSYGKLQLAVLVGIEKLIQTAENK
jgi:hexosaminidase